MSESDADWALLDLARTDDRRAIRSAYAAQLKAIDPETQPQAFIKLRNAYERALAAAVIPVQIDSAAELTTPLPPLETDTDADAQALAAIARPTPTDGSAEPANSLPQVETDPAERHAGAILGILSRDVEAPWLDTEAQHALISHWQALVGNARMEQLDHADRVERWACAVIADTSPRSAPILMLAAERFGWVDADHDVQSSRAVVEIARRYRLLQLLQAAARPGSPYHSAWVELHRPAADRSRTVRPETMFELIAATQYALPQLAEDFDPIRLATWELRAEDARAAREEPEFEPPPHRATCAATLLIILVLAFGLRFAANAVLAK